MKTKTFSLLSLSILALVIFANLASAVTFLDSSNSTLLTASTSVVAGNIATISFKANSTQNISSVLFNTPITMTSGSNTFTSAGSVTSAVSTLTANISSNLMSLTFAVPSAQANGTYTGTLNLTGDLIVYTLPITITVTRPNEPDEVTSCALTGANGDLRIRIKDVNVVNINQKSFGDDDNFWYPLDEVEMEIEVENRGDDDIDNIEVEWGLYDVDDDDWIIDDKENDFNLKDGDKKTLTIKFKLEDVDDFQNKDYTFYVWANGEVDDANNTDVCTSESLEIDIVNDDNFVRLYNINFPEVVSCGEEVQILADVVNLGDTNQDEVSVLISNTQLGISKVVEIGDINDFDSEKLDTFITIPSNAENKVYFISLKVYDDNNDIYETDEDNDKSEFSVSLRVEGCKTASKASVTASLESGGKAGEDLVVKAIVINTGDKSATYSISAAGYSEWASSVGISQQTFTLDKGSSKDVAFTFKVKDDVSGDKSFDIELISGNELIVKQPVQVTIEGKTGGFLTGFTTFSGNGYLWVIGALNVILIFAIIIVAIKVARR